MKNTNISKKYLWLLIVSLVIVIIAGLTATIVLNIVIERLKIFFWSELLINNKFDQGAYLLDWIVIFQAVTNIIFTITVLFFFWPIIKLWEMKNNQKNKTKKQDEILVI